MSFSLAGLDEVVSAFKTNNAANVSKFFDSRIEISLYEKSDSYSKQQGEIILQDFFANHSIKGLTVVHKGENNGNKYCICNATTSNGKFRITFYMKQKDDTQILQSIRIEES
jgi:Domain of unknown function (DUF4783)